MPHDKVSGSMPDKPKPTIRVCEKDLPGITKMTINSSYPFTGTMTLKKIGQDDFPYEYEKGKKYIEATFEITDIKSTKKADDKDVSEAMKRS